MPMLMLHGKIVFLLFIYFCLFVFLGGSLTLYVKTCFDLNVFFILILYSVKSEKKSRFLILQINLNPDVFNPLSVAVQINWLLSI